MWNADYRKLSTEKNEKAQNKITTFPIPKQKYTCMKKVIAFVAVVVCFSVTTAMAQGGPGGQQTPEQRAAQMKERLAPANLTAVQQDSVIAIWNDRAIMAQVYGTSDFQSISREDRMAKAPAMNEARQKRLEKAGLSADQAKKVVELLSMRPGGGGRPGGGK